MLFFSRSHAAPLLALACATTVGCLSEPPPDNTYDAAENVSGEVFRVFCRRAASRAHPTDVSGERFYALCDGEGDASDETDATLRALIDRRPEIIAALEQTFAEPAIEGGASFDDGELSGFLRQLVPLYDKPDETIPKSTRGIASLFERLIDPTDERARKVLETVARLSQRSGYRPPAQVLGAARALLTYEELDQLSAKLLKVVAEGGSAEGPWLEVLRAAALELADEAEPSSSDPDATTLHKAVELLLTPADRFAGEQEAWVLTRSAETGDAQGAGPDRPTPFPVLGRDDDADRDAARAGLASGYEAFDASRTPLAALMRETKALIDRDGEPRSALESFAHGVKPLLGAWGARSRTIGKAQVSFEGPDVDDGPLLELAHGLALLARYPETARLMRVLEKLLEGHESEAAATVFAGLRIDELADEYEDAKLIGVDGEGTPHEFWDDLLSAGERMTKRPGLLPALVDSFADPRSGVQGKLFANWMRYRDVVTYEGAPLMPGAVFTPEEQTKINAPIAHTYSEEVERNQPDVGMNRSIWQRTMSLIAALNGVPVCNKAKAVLNVPTPLGPFVFPAFDLAAEGYKPCDLIEMQDAVETYSRAVLKEGSVVIKDELAGALAGLGELIGITGNVGQIQEKESQLKGFTDKPSPESLSRFLFAPRNKFITDLFTPLESVDKLPIAEYEPYALFPMENPDSQVLLEGAPQSFITAGVPLLSAFDKAELRQVDVVTGTTKLSDGYMFGHLMTVVHKHWSSRKEASCSASVVAGDEGCTQSLDPTQALYSPQTNLVSYEPLLIRALDDEDLLGHLHRATVALAKITVDGKTGTQILGEFAQRILTPDSSLRKRDGSTHSKTNTCVEMTDASGKRACAGGRGRIIEPLSPIYVVLDALKRFDDTFAERTNEERLEAWRSGRSKLVDQLLTIDKKGGADPSFALRDRSAHGLALSLLPWAAARIEEHESEGDLVAWSDGLSTRLADVLGHPLAAATIDLLDKFWDEPEASGEFTKVSAALLDEAENNEAFTGMLVAAADTLTLLDRDPDLTPAIQFASLALAPNALEAVAGEGEPDVKGGVAHAALALTQRVVETLNPEDSSEPTTLSKLLTNLVLSDGTRRSPLEVLLDAVADVNRGDASAPPEQPLSADEDRRAFGEVKTFLRDDSEDQRSMERLYSVIQERKVQ
jgi:hypothetical protein